MVEKVREYLIGMAFEVAFFAGHGICDQGSSAFFSCVDCE
jgi:hypothetical protein